MYFEKSLRLEQGYIEVIRYTEDGPVWIHHIDKYSSHTQRFEYREAAKLGWLLLDGASATGQPYPVKDGE